MASFFTITQPFLISGLLIFCLRVIDMTLDTLRVLFVVRGKRLYVWILGAAQSAVFFLAVSQALKGDLNVITTLGYAFGFATGNLVGMVIEEKLAIGYQRVTITTHSKPGELASDLRNAGYGATELVGYGRDGEVLMVHVNCKRKQVDDVERIVFERDPKAFLTIDDFNPVRSTGYYRK